MIKINLDEKFALFEEHWRPKAIAALNHPLCQGVMCFPFALPILRAAGVSAAKLVPSELLRAMGSVPPVGWPARWEVWGTLAG